MMLTLTLPVEAWVTAGSAVFIGAKFIQRGGVRFGRGETWKLVTLPGVLMHVAVIVGGFGMLLLQNTN